ncbi:MAG: hypothetical protein QM755_22195 [Luteolibacter sp.]
MTAARTARSSGEGSMWGLSLVISLVLNTLVFLAIALIAPPEVKPSPKATSATPATTAIIELVMPSVIEPVAAAQEKPREPAPEPPPAAEEPTPAVVAIPAPPSLSSGLTFQQTSEEQASSEAPVKAMFIGEHNTRATSDRAPDPGAAPLPSQQGTPAKEREETLAQTPPAPTPPSPPKQPAVTVEQLPPGPAVTVEPAVTIEQDPPMEGPHPLAVPVPRPPVEPAPAPEPPKPAAAEPTPPAPQPAQQNPSAGKTRINGSISRTGTSAVDVVDSPRGRYQAVVNRLVGEEFMRNCERYQKLITPGFMTVRFMISQDGKLGKDVTVVEEVDCTIQQKGFTIQSIRSAKFPPLPPELKKTLGREPFDLTIRFDY